jgi:hypothetical protein
MRVSSQVRRDTNGRRASRVVRTSGAVGTVAAQIGRRGTAKLTGQRRIPGGASAPETGPHVLVLSM